MNYRRAFEENASLIVAWLALLYYLFMSGIDSVHAKGFLYVEVTAWLLSISAFFSVRTVVRLAIQFLPAVGWWLHGLLRWTSWWIVHVLVASLVVGISVSGMRGVPDQMPGILILGIPSLVLVWHVVRDYSYDRRRFGSIAQATRALYRATARRP